MKLNKFFVPYKDDKRMIFAREYLENNGFISVDSYEKTDFILLPVPVKNYMLEQAGDKPVFYGMGEHKNGFDYMTEIVADKLLDCFSSDDLFDYFFTATYDFVQDFTFDFEDVDEFMAFVDSNSEKLDEYKEEYPSVLSWIESGMIV